MLYVAQQSMYYGIIHLCTVCIQLECMHNIMFPDSLWNEKINKNDEKNRVVLFDFVFMSLAFMQSLYFSFIFLCFLRFHDLHIYVLSPLCICSMMEGYTYGDLKLFFPLLTYRLSSFSSDIHVSCVFHFSYLCYLQN